MACEKFALALGLCLVVGNLQIVLVDGLTCVSCTQKDCTTMENFSDDNFGEYEKPTTGTNELCLLYLTKDKNGNTIYNREPATEAVASCSAVTDLSVTACYECSDADCNKDVDNARKAYNKCYECDSRTPDKNCFDVSTLTDDDICYLDSAIQKECFTHQYVDVNNGKTVIRRGCLKASDNKYCDGSTDTQLNIQCNTCSDTDKCNTDITSNKYCVSCDECNTSLTHLTKDNYTQHDDQNSCTVFQYRTSDNKITTARGVGDCSSIAANHTNDLILCNECNNDDSNTVCNLDINTTQGRASCIQCSSEESDDCEKKPSDATTCQLDDVVQTSCFTRKYIKSNSTYVTERGCFKKNDTDNTKCDLPTDNDQETVINTLCSQCSNVTELCNKEVSFDNEKKLCYQCDGDNESSPCAAKQWEIASNSNVTTCESSACLTYFYYQNGVKHIKRTCVSENETEEKVKNRSDVTYCSQCSLEDQSTELCNTQTFEQKDEKLICYSCDNCKQNETDDQYCTLEAGKNSSCISYSYVNDDNTYIVKTCNTTTFCDDLIANKDKPNVYTGTLKTCLKSNEILGNKDLNTTEISGSPSMVFSASFLLLLSIGAMLCQL